MSKKKGSSELSTIIVSLESCLALIASAVEVYPKECIGCLLVRRSKKSQSSKKIAGVFSYQLAKRSRDAVTSYSLHKMRSFALRSKKWDVLGEFHSHPYTESEKETPTEPSIEDLKGLKVGNIEIIVKIVNGIRFHKSSNPRHKKNGTINMNVGYYECNILAFRKLRDIKIGRKKCHRYETIKLKVK